MAKRLGISPKKLETVVSAASLQLEAKVLLKRAVPRFEDEKLKNYYPRAAWLLGWSPRRVRAYLNGEARIINHLEILALNQRIESAKAATQAAREHANEIRLDVEMGSDRSAVDVQPTHGVRGKMEPGRGVVPGSAEE